MTLSVIFSQTILSVPFCPYHFVQYHFVLIPFCPYHFVRTILSATILSGHHIKKCQLIAKVQHTIADQRSPDYTNFHEIFLLYHLIVNQRGMVAHWQIRRLWSKRSRVQIPLQPPRRDPGQVLHSQLPVALWHETPTQYPGCVGSASE